MADSNLLQRGTTWYARLSAPATLQRALVERGKKPRADLFRSLGTGDKLEAKRRLPAKLTQMHQQFADEEAALRSEAPELHEPSEYELQAEAFDLVRRELLLDDQERASRPTREQAIAAVQALRLDLDRDPPKTSLEREVREINILNRASPDRSEFRHDLQAELKESLRTNSFHLIDWAIQDAAQRRQWRLPPDSPRYKLFGRHLMQSWLRALQTQSKRDDGNYEEPTPIAQLPVAGSIQRGAAMEAAPAPPKKGETLSDYFETFLAEAHPGLGKAGLKDKRATLRQFVQTAGSKRASDYVRGDMTSFKRLLNTAPARSGKLYPGLTLPQAVKRNAQDGNPLLTAASVRNKLSTMAVFGEWLEANVDGVDANSFKTTLPRKTDRERMEPFTGEEIAKILNARAFTGCQSDKNQLLPGDYRIRDYRFWVPVIAAFTGARLNEITQLRVQDLRQEEGVWVFDLMAEGDGQSVKTKQSKRLVPIHPRLIELGVLVLRDRLAEQGVADLFPEIPLDADDRRSTRAGKTFRKFLERIGVKQTGALGGAHRWRHTLTDALREVGVTDGEIAQILGHGVDIAKMTAHYGARVGHLTLQQKHDLLAQVCYSTADFALLMPAPVAHQDDA